MTTDKDGGYAIARSGESRSATERKAPGLESHLRRFDPDFRRRVRAMSRSSERVADLVKVFPAAIHRLADPDLSQHRRANALAAVNRGVPLKAVAELLELPVWLRRLPPDAFRGDIPSFPASTDFSRRIATRLPRRRRVSRTWLEATAFAVQAAGEDFALWVAERPEIIPAGLPVQNALRVLALYAAAHRDGPGEASRLLGARWRPELGTDRALCAAMSWFNRVRLVTLLKGRRLDPWLRPATVNGIRFEPLTTVEELLLEAQLMNNCVDQYATPLCTDRCRLFSVRRDSTRIATVEVARHPKEPAVLTITQLKGPSNVPAPVTIWQAAYGWLAQQDQLMSAPSLYSTLPRGQSRVWTNLFSTYRNRRGGAPWWPTSPSMQALSALDSELKQVAREASVVSWLFR
ncbi:MAG: PcfJ domain-containing protein [Pseudomonadota bacterium]